MVQVIHLIEDRGVSPLLANAVSELVKERVYGSGLFLPNAQCDVIWCPVMHQDGWTAVHFAIMKGHLDVVLYLIQQGSSVTVANIVSHIDSSVFR